MPKVAAYLARMDLGTDWAELGMAGLFLASFLAATILPFSSEVLLLGMAGAGGDLFSLFVVATAGNTLGGLFNYALGRWIPAERMMRWMRLDVAKAERWRVLVQRRGAWAALLCWVPVIGDPIAVALGVLRSPFAPTALLMLTGKAVRYAVVLWLARPWL